MKKFLLLTAISFSGFVIAQTNYQQTYTISDQYYSSDVEWSSPDQSYVMSAIDSGGLTLLKVDQTGTPMFNRHFSFPGTTLGYTVKIAIATDGNIYACSQFNMTSGSDVSYLVLAVDQWMTPLWSKVYTTESWYIYDELQFGFLPDGNLMITESVSGHVGYIKTDLAGNVMESNMYREDTTAEGKGPGFDASAFPDGSMIFTGKRENDIMAVRTDPSGNVLWSRVLNDGTNYYHTKSVAALSDGTSILSGYAYNASFIMRLDANGGIMWYKEYTSGIYLGGVFFDVQQIDANSFMAVGDFSNGKMLVKFDMNGQVISSMQLDPGQAYTSGAMHYTMNSAGNIAWPFIAYDFNMAWEMKTGLTLMTSLNTNGCGMNAGSLQQSTVAVTPSELAVPIYKMPQTITDSIVVPVVTQRVVQMDNYCWLIGMEEPAATNSGLTLQSNLLMQGSSLNFTIENFTGDATYTIHDINGKEVGTGKFENTGGNQLNIPQVATFANGMYVLSVIAGENRMSEKFVIQ